MSSRMVWVVCWRRRGVLPTLPVIGSLHTQGGRPPEAWYLSHLRGRGGWAWTSKADRAKAFYSRADAERARADAGAARSAAVCCVSPETLHAAKLNVDGKEVPNALPQ